MHMPCGTKLSSNKTTKLDLLQVDLTSFLAHIGTLPIGVHTYQLVRLDTLFF